MCLLLSALIQSNPPPSLYQCRLTRRVCNFQTMPERIVLRVGKPVVSISLQGAELPGYWGEIAGQVPANVLRVLGSHLRIARSPVCGRLP
jgi:hypothetical protein